MHHIFKIKQVIAILLGSLSIINSAFSAPFAKYSMPFKIDDISAIIDQSLWQFDCGPPNWGEGTCVYKLSEEFEIVANSFSADLYTHHLIVRWLKPRKDKVASNEYFIKICTTLHNILFNKGKDFFPLMKDFKNQISIKSEEYNIWFDYGGENALCEAAVRE